MLGKNVKLELYMKLEGEDKRFIGSVKIRVKEILLSSPAETFHSLKLFNNN